VILADLYLVSAVGTPDEADPPLVVDADAVLSVPVSPEQLEPIARRASEVLEARGGIDHEKLPVGLALHVSR
jgi:hypothetical protein